MSINKDKKNLPAKTDDSLINHAEHLLAESYFALRNLEQISKETQDDLINIINKQNRVKLTRGRKVKVSGYKKAIITLKKGQSIDLTTGI